MTLKEVAAAIIDGSSTAYGAFASEPAMVIGGITARAARGDALLTHLACALIEQSGNPSLIRGAVLDGLVARFGDGLER